MRSVRIKGTCVCGQFTEAHGADEDDARDMLNHSHGMDFKHSFDGDVTFRREDSQLKLDLKPVQRLDTRSKTCPTNADRRR